MRNLIFGKLFEKKTFPSFPTIEKGSSFFFTDVVSLEVSQLQFAQHCEDSRLFI